MKEKQIPYGKQTISEEDINSVVEVLKSDYLTQGPKVEEFELSLVNYTGAKFCHVVNSGTAGLHLACLAIEVGPGDIVWTSANSFVASANCILYCGANVDFIDIDINTLSICPLALEAKLKKANEKNKLPKAVIVVHHSGYPAEMSQIKKLSKKYGFKIIEDACHALGATYDSEKIGSCSLSDICVFSFHPIKSITTAEGGAVLTNNKKIAEKIFMLRTHGIIKNSSKLESTNHGQWYYEQQLLGFNYRMPDINAVLGISQLKKLDEFISKRRILHKEYIKLLEGLPLLLPPEGSSRNSACHLFVIQLLTEQVKKSHQEVFEELRAAGVQVNLHYIPIYYHPYYKKIEIQFEKCENAELYYSRAITLPLFPTLNREEQVYVVQKLRDIICED